jgi:hypothetical protein
MRNRLGEMARHVADSVGTPTYLPARLLELAPPEPAPKVHGSLEIRLNGTFLQSGPNMRFDAVKRFDHTDDVEFEAAWIRAKNYMRDLALVLDS